MSNFFAKNYINHNPQTVTNPSTCLLMTPSGQKSKLLYTSYLEKCIAFYLSRFTDRTPYTAMPPAFCVLFFMGSGYWVVRHCYSVQWYLFINNKEPGLTCSSACWLACLRFLSPPPPFYLLSNDLIILERKSQMWGLALPHICSCSINKFRYSSLRGPSQALLFQRLPWIEKYGHQ